MLGDDSEASPASGRFGPSFQPLDRKELIWMIISLISICLVTGASMHIVLAGPS